MGLLKKFISGFLVLGFSIVPFFTVTASPINSPINLEGPELLPKTEIFITPRTGNFLVGSTFEVPFYLDTKGHNINAISLKIRFDPNKLVVTKPASDRSIFGIWIEAPKYDNKNGTASLVGVIEDGIVTSSGLIGIITFKAIAPGSATINISDYTTANLHDGFGSEVKLNLRGATYTISPTPPEGLIISSETHPSEDNWYNNNSPILNWQGFEAVDGYSLSFDNNPNTIPINEINMRDSYRSYENVRDGIWYFHVKPFSRGLWGNTSHFRFKIDTQIPAIFKPSASIIKNDKNSKKYLLSFLTTDSLSGLEHYEVGIINNNDALTVSPIFIETQSPYLLPVEVTSKIKVLIRAYDQAGNIREVSLDLNSGYNFWSLIKNYNIYFFLFVLILILLIILLILHYLFSHHTLSNIKNAYIYFKRVSIKEKLDSGSSDKIPLPPIYYIKEKNEKATKVPDVIKSQSTINLENKVNPFESVTEMIARLKPENQKNAEQTESMEASGKIALDTPIPNIMRQEESKGNFEVLKTEPIIVKSGLIIEKSGPIIEVEEERIKSSMEKFINPKLIQIDEKKY